MGFWKNFALFSSLVSAVVMAGPVIKRDDVADAMLKNCPGYAASNVKKTATGMTADLSLGGRACNVYGKDFKNLTLEITYDTDSRLHVKIQDPENQVYQVPESVFPRPTDANSSADSSHLNFNYHLDPFFFTISRADTGEVVFDTSAATLVFESQYLRLRTKLPDNPNLYGLGEHFDPFRLNTTDYTRTMWNYDTPVPPGSNLYGTHPIYIEQRETGAHGVFLLNSNGMDIKINNTNGEDQYLEYNTLGGVLDFWFFEGPTPIEVAQQYNQIAGNPAMGPYWGLGFHQCRYGYQDVYNVAEVAYNYSQANIPLETMWTDIDYMDGRKDFTLDPLRFPLHKMQQLISHLHAHDQHYILMVDPAIAYENYPPLNRGVDDNIFLLQSNGSAFLGVVWPGVTVFPDWFADGVGDWWSNEFKIFFDANTGVDIDGLWIDMNEPSIFPCTYPCDVYQVAASGGFPPTPPPVREPPRPLPGWPCDFQPPDICKSKRDVLKGPNHVEYVPREVKTDSLVLPARPDSSSDQKGLAGRDLLFPKYNINNKAGHLSDHTVYSNVIHQNGLAEYDAHNIFGAMMSAASRDAMKARRPGLRPLIITRSTFPGAGSKVSHWLGDNHSTWDDYRASIRTMLAFTSIYGFNYIGSDVCGFEGAVTEELCGRWAALGAFQTFYRNHKNAGDPSQEFYLWPSVADSARKAIAIRYRLLDYIYTAMYRASSVGTPALNPMFYIYPQDNNTWPLELQYFFGGSILVAPVTDEGSTTANIYLPNDLFYDWYTQEPVQGKGAIYTMTGQDSTDIPLFIRSGVVLPLRAESANTTTALRKQSFELLVAEDKDGKATGELYLDDGVSLEQASFTDMRFAYDNGALTLGGTVSPDYPVHVSKVTVLTSKKNSTGKTSRTKSVNVAINKPQTIQVGL